MTDSKITPINRKSTKNDAPAIKPAPKPSAKSERATKKPHAEPMAPKHETAVAVAEPTVLDRIREIDQAAIAPNVTLDDLQRLSMNFTDIVDELPEGATLPEPPAGYERCADCGLPTPVGGNGLCRLHDVHMSASEPATAEAPTEQPSKAPAEPSAEREPKVFGPIQIRKLARERVWFIFRHHNLPMVKPGAKDAEGYVLSTDDVGGTVGRVLVTYSAPTIADADERRKFVIVQIEKALEILRSAELEVVRANIDGTPYITVPTTRVPGKVDEPAKRGPRSGKSATWSLPLTTVGEEQGSGI